MINDTTDIKIVTAAFAIAEYYSFASSLNYIDLFFDECALQNEDDYVIRLSKIISSASNEFYLLIHRLETDRQYYIDQIKRNTKDKNVGKALAMVTSSLMMVIDAYSECKNKKQKTPLYHLAKNIGEN